MISLHRRHRSIRLPKSLKSLLVSLVVVTGATPVLAGPYVLVPEDKVTLRVVEWRSAEAKYTSWEALQGLYSLDSDGNVSVPVAGQIQAGGKTTEEVADAIASALAEKAGLPGKPFIALEVTEHAPIFVSGTVQNPGRFPFETNMTVMKAVSIAGGFLRARDGSSVFERDRIQAAGAFRTATISRRDLLMTQARLRAEIAGQTDFDIPPELVDLADAAALKNEELNLMRLRRVEVDSQIAATDDLAKLYGHEVDSLGAKIASQKRQIDIAKKELENVNGLVSKGLTTSSRQFSLDRGVSELESSLLDLEIALTKAKQAVSESAREKSAIINKQNAENQQQLNTIELSLGKASIDIQVAQLLGEQAGYSAQLAQVDTQSSALGATRKTFKIMRRGSDGAYQAIDADETTELLPHDLVEIGFGSSADAPSAITTPSVTGSLMRDNGQTASIADLTKRLK
jgi:exopolysaccharide production protein ExoF